jgi:penicillin-binding protein 1A
LANSPARLARILGIAALFLIAALLGTAGGVLFAYAGDLPEISALDDFSPPTITRVLGRDGTVVGDFATERRQLVTYAQIPPVLRNAILSSEDKDFFSHGGLDLRRIAVTAVRRVLHLQRYGGASTLTQQLARKLFLTDEYSYERKIKEQLLALQIEKRYTKQEIFTMFCNKMYWGHGAYGVEAASELYFAKHVQDLNLDEAAVVAGLLQGNVRQSPYVNMKAAVARRNYVLDRMADNGYINRGEATEAKKHPIVVRGQPNQKPSIAPYFMETVRQHLEDQYGAKALYENGLVVKTGLDPELQRSANAALDRGLRVIDKMRGFRKPTHNVLTDRTTLESAKLPQWTRDPQAGDLVPGIVMGVDANTIRVRVNTVTGTIDRAGWIWMHRKPDDVIHKGDVIDVRVTKVDEKSGFSAELEQTPDLQGAVLAIDNHTGQIMAMVGGEDFGHSQFNRATQALRQVGSLFKPFVFTAALDRGYTAINILPDEPVSYNVGPNQPLYEPKNFDRKYEGPVTLRHALEDSRNVPTVWLMNELGPAQVIPYAHKMGITSPIPPYLSTAIGSAEATLLEMTSAYTSFPNQGVRMTPTSVLDVTDRDGNLLEHNGVEPHDSLRADTAYVMTNLLRGVVLHGTASARVGEQKTMQGWPLGGKTGTTDDFGDAWFIGFDPDITIGVWVGFDLKKTIGPDMQGARAALPIWVDIMKTWIDRRRKELPDVPDFARPNNVVIAQTDNGPEAFIAGTEPKTSGGG